MADESVYGQDFDLGLIADEDGRVFAGPYTRIDLQAKLIKDISPRVTDIGLIDGKANLIQSLILRLKTEKGELSGLGHPNYGSQHHRLIGEPNTENNRNLIKIYVLECLKQEPRIEKILKISVNIGQGRENRDKVNIDISIKIKNHSDPLSLVIPFSFEGSLE